MIQRFPFPSNHTRYDTFRIVQCSVTSLTFMIFLWSKPNNNESWKYIQYVVQISKTSCALFREKGFQIESVDMTDVEPMEYLVVKICRRNDCDWSLVIADKEIKDREYGKYTGSFDASHYPFDIDPERFEQIV